MNESRFLTAAQRRGFLKAGDALVAGGEGFPSFSASGVIRDADRMLAYMTESDRKGLLGLFAVLARAPAFATRFLLWLAERDRFFPGPIGAGLRMVALGVKGAVFTLYYSDEKIHPRIGWDAKIVRPA